QSFVLTTAIQLANLYATIANGGTIYRPYVVKRVENNNGQVLQEFNPEIVNKVQISQKTLELVRQGLWGVVNNERGTAYSQRLPGIDFAGKTGSAQVVHIAEEKLFKKYACESMKFKERQNALFVGYAPTRDPAISVAVIAEHACHGASGAAPIVRQTIKSYLEKYNPTLYGAKAKAKVRPEPTTEDLEDSFAIEERVDLPAQGSE
ncbi:MAG: hypothetical protein HY843_08650, partial [Bdellovibrio sp.]|nr:hypothetical protein [Bdellovibrio sp.]